MTADPLLPIAPARVKALVLPLGQITRPRFASFLERLGSEHVVHLRDISADGRPNRNMFSPLAFPDGAIFYEFITHVPPPSHLALSPFDLYREPLAVIALADGAECEKVMFSKRQSGAATIIERNIRTLYQELEDLRDAYPKAIVHQVLLFDYEPSEENPVPIPEGLVPVPPLEKSKRTTMRTVMCDISSMLLAEMTTLAKSFEAKNYIDSPGQSSSIRQLNGSSWGEDSTTLQRRNSQFALPNNSRSASAGGVIDKSYARMSMPPVPSKGSPLGSSSSSPAGRPSTPTRSGLSNPPTTFDDISNGQSPEPSSPEQSLPSRPGSAGGFRTSSQDRVAVQGFGPGGINERWRNKGKGRVTIVMGSLYLQAGRWTDALKELIDGATVARSINDHLWHGKALELIVVCLILLGWARIQFVVPTICLPALDKGVLSTPTTDEHSKPDQPKHFRHFQIILPELLDRIIGLYSRISAEHLPPLPLSEAIIRSSRILAALHVADGQFDTESLKMMIFGDQPEKKLTTSPRLTITPSRTQIVNTLFRAFPASSTELLTTVDRIVILSGIASVLGVLGLQRKKAMVVRELVSVLIGGLVEARTRGAAEVGIHPAAGLAALNGMNGVSHGAAALELGENDIEFGVDAFLGILLKTYGVVCHDVGYNILDDAKMVTDESDESSAERILKQSAARSFGMPQIKLNVLRACINFSEALPDFDGVLKFSSDLLRTAGSGVAPGPRREDASAKISVEEQVRLVTNITKTNNLAKRLGLGDLEAEYWDEFLVRGIKLEPLAMTRTPIEHLKSELPGASTVRTSQDVNPFIHNPFQKQPDKLAVVKTLVAGEVATFKITLQNPYDVDLEIQSLRLDTEGIEFESIEEVAVLGAYRTQILKVRGIPKQAGSLRIIGAIVHIRGCRERRFPIFSNAWSPETELKIKAIGPAALDRSIAIPLAGTPPKAEQVGLNVISEQPVVVVKSTTLPQSSVMILEGERQVFSVTLQNLSSTTPADFLLFSFQDSTQAPLQAALDNREATPAELYEYELILAKKQALKLRNSGRTTRYIAPGGSATFEFEILGKPGLTSGTVQVDYAFLGVPPEDVADKFFTRQVSLQLTVTVNASVDISRMDVLPLHGSIPRPLWDRTIKNGEAVHDFTAEKYCLLLLDLRNAWPSSMTAQLEVEDGVVIEEQILPGNTSRVILPVKRIYLEDPHASIPALNPSRQRQFVVSASKISPDVERSNREAFWYREKILDTLKGTWRTGTAPTRSGTIELRSIRLTPRMIEAVKVDEIGIKISVEDPTSTGKTAGKTVFVDEFVQVKVRVTNRTEQPIHPTVRVMPALCHRPLNVALDFTRKFAWNGTLQHFLPPLQGKSSTDVIIGATALCRGEFEITASVEETQLWRPTVDEEKKRQSGRPRSETQTMLDAALGAKERRIWHSRQPCHIIVRDRE